jgi:protein TonB
MAAAARRGQGDGGARGRPAALYPPIRLLVIFRLTMRNYTALIAGVLIAAACPAADTTKQAMDALTAAGQKPDEMPVLLNTELPFRYPEKLYASKVQANVVLRIYIDSTGAVWPDSTIIMKSSGYPEFDSAAVKGAPELHFIPAKLQKKPIGVDIQLPVYFRHPGSGPLPGDTVLQKKATPAAKP